jgi:hypothetical protein
MIICFASSFILLLLLSVLLVYLRIEICSLFTIPSPDLLPQGERELKPHQPRKCGISASLQQAGALRLYLCCLRLSPLTLYPSSYGFRFAQSPRRGEGISLCSLLFVFTLYSILLTLNFFISTHFPMSKRPQSAPPIPVPEEDASLSFRFWSWEGTGQILSPVALPERITSCG